MAVCDLLVTEQKRCSRTDRLLPQLLLGLGALSHKVFIDIQEANDMTKFLMIPQKIPIFYSKHSCSFISHLKTFCFSNITHSKLGGRGLGYTFSILSQKLKWQKFTEVYFLMYHESRDYSSAVYYCIVLLYSGFANRQVRHRTAWNAIYLFSLLLCDGHYQSIIAVFAVELLPLIIAPGSFCKLIGAGMPPEAYLPFSQLALNKYF